MSVVSRLILPALGPAFMHFLQVTADGSIDCANTPAQQESLVSHLLFCETAVALNVLNEGGSFVLKTFTMFECQTVCLLYLLATCFNEVHRASTVIEQMHDLLYTT